VNQLSVYCTCEIFEVRKQSSTYCYR